MSNLAITLRNCMHISLQYHRILYFKITTTTKRPKTILKDAKNDVDRIPEQMRHATDRLARALYAVTLHQLVCLYCFQPVKVQLEAHYGLKMSYLGVYYYSHTRTSDWSQHWESFHLDRSFVLYVIQWTREILVHHIQRGYYEIREKKPYG